MLANPRRQDLREGAAWRTPRGRKVQQHEALARQRSQRVDRLPCVAIDERLDARENRALQRRRHLAHDLGSHIGILIDDTADIAVTHYVRWFLERAIHMIEIVTRERERPVLGEVVGDASTREQRAK